MFADHDEVQDVARQMTRTKAELERSVQALRGWARDLGRRLEPSSLTVERQDELRTLGETVGGLAHNLNNSLAAILAYAEMMLRDQQTETARRRLTVMRDVALEASMTVRRLQESVSPQPPGRASGPVELPAVVADAVGMTAPRWRDDAQRRGIAIRITQDLAALPPVEGNAVELRDAVAGLILNAVTAMPDGGALTIRAATAEPGWVAVEVRDTGAGMADEVRQNVMDQGRAAVSGRATDHGLDRIAAIVERHGGALAIENLPDHGTAVTFRLRASRFQIMPPSPGTGERPRGRARARVLLVDDEPRLVAALGDMLRAEGHPVTTATDGRQALGLFDPESHDVVITDLGMPGINGWELAGQVKRRSPSTAVFILTGWGESVLTDESSQFVDRVIAKPVSAESLLGQLAELARSRASST
jgi:signal transduction histidine kinase